MEHDADCLCQECCNELYDSNSCGGCGWCNECFGTFEFLSEQD